MTTTTAPVTPAGPLTADDPRSVFGRAVAIATATIRAVRTDQLDLPTPCDELSVRDLLGHLVHVLHRVAAVGRGENPFDPALEAGAVADDGWEGTWLAAAHAVQAAWTDDAVLDRIVVLPWSQLPGGATLLGYANEITVHTWDLARATGQAPAWDDEVTLAALGAIQAVLPAGERDALFAALRKGAPEGMTFDQPFAEAVEVADDAPAIDRLVAWNGRRPR